MEEEIVLALSELVNDAKAIRAHLELLRREVSEGRAEDPYSSGKLQALVLSLKNEAHLISQLTRLLPVESAG